MGHIHDQYDFTTSGFIVHDNKILLVHHKKIGKWLQPGGHIELHEDPFEALLREIREETGLEQSDIEIIDFGPPNRPHTIGHTKSLPIPFDFNVHDVSDTHRHIDLTYLIKSRTDRLELEAEKAHAIGWFSAAELKAKYNAGDMFEHTYNYAIFALKVLSDHK